MPATHEYAGIHSGRFINARFEGHSYDDYFEFLVKCQCNRQIIAANVRVVFDPQTYLISIRLYETDIITYTPGEKFWACDGGYVTATTTTRMSQFGPLGVRFWRSGNRVWCSRGPIGRDHVYPVEKPPLAPVYHETDPRVAFDPLRRRRRSIRLHP